MKLSHALAFSAVVGCSSAAEIDDSAPPSPTETVILSPYSPNVSCEVLRSGMVPYDESPCEGEPDDTLIAGQFFEYSHDKVVMEAIRSAIACVYKPLDVEFIWYNGSDGGPGTGKNQVFLGGTSIFEGDSAETGSTLLDMGNLHPDGLFFAVDSIIDGSDILLLHPNTIARNVGHELGHGFGLEHSPSSASPSLMAPFTPDFITFETWNLTLSHATTVVNNFNARYGTDFSSSTVDELTSTSERCWEELDALANSEQ